MIFDPQTRKLTPSDGLYLSQKVLENEDERIFSTLMFLGVGDTPENYAEKTQAEKEQWEAEHPQPEDDPQS